MKGLTHFVAGVGFASFWPHAVEAATRGNPWYFVLGGAAGLLPDTLDFKLARYFFRHDREIVPDPSHPDPALIATALAGAIHEARASGKAVRVKLNTVRVAAGLWGQYRLTFDETRHRVTVAYNGVVNTGRAPVRDEAHPPSEASVPLECSVLNDYEATTTLDIFEGPTFALEPQPNGRVCIRFIPWHRQWSHSLTLAAGLGLLAGGLAGVQAALIAAGACGLHILADQLGFMGSNLFFPFTKQRRPGRQLIRSDNATANFAVIWFACLLIYWNLARAAPPPVAGPSLINLLLYTGILPLVLARLAGRAASGGLTLKRRPSGQSHPTTE
jgi:membrane-bound metal-dependent hydrolase YbcI (DUF457 family)